MNTNPRDRASRRSLRVAAVTWAGLLSGAALLLTGCSSGAPASQAGPAEPERQPAAGAPAIAPHAAAGSAAAPTAPAAQLTLSAQSIIYTASVTLQTANVSSAASRAAGIATAAGGYISSEHESVSAPGHAGSAATLQVKIPVAQYPAALGRLSALPGTRRTSLSQQAQNVTQQVADVGSLVTAAQAGITQLEALLKRAGSVSDLLSVQEQISAQESALDSLEAQQRALSRETSYATVSITLVSPRRRTAAKRRSSQNGFVAGLASGWRGLRLVVSAVLTALGAALPFAAGAALVAGAGYAGRRPLRRLLRHRSRRAAAG